MKATPDYDFSHIDSVVGVQQQAVECTKAFLSQLPQAEICCEEFFTDAPSINQQLLNFQKLILLLSSEETGVLFFLIKASEKVAKIFSSSQELQAELKEKDKLTVTDVDKFKKFRVQALNGIFSAIKSVDSEGIEYFTFEMLCNFSEFFIELSNCFEKAFKKEDISAFKGKFQALKSRRAEIIASRNDWGDSLKLYASYMQRVLGTLDGIALSPKDTSTVMFSKVFNSLVSAVRDVAELSPNKETIVNGIDRIVEEERETLKKYKKYFEGKINYVDS